MKTLIDTGGNCVIMPGPGGFEMKLSPGSRVVRCEDAVSGHMMVPVSDFESRTMKSKTKWILYGTLGDKDKPRSPRSRTPEMPRHRPCAQRFQHLYHSWPCGNTCILRKNHDGPHRCAYHQQYDDDEPERVKDNNDKHYDSFIKTARQSNAAACLNFSKEGGHANLQ